jgi:hypothetical protein
MLNERKNMGGYRDQRPLGTSDASPCSLDDGTSQRTRMAPPGPICNATGAGLPQGNDSAMAGH